MKHHLKKMTGHRFSKYFSIGIFTTLLTLLFWNILIWCANTFASEDYLKENADTIFSVTQFVASSSMIYPSYYLNRIFTFKDKEHSHNNGFLNLFKIYSIYLSAPLIASLATYIILQIYNFESITWSVVNLEIKIGRYFLQGFAIILGVILNYKGQKLFLYKK